MSSPRISIWSLPPAEPAPPREDPIDILISATRVATRRQDSLSCRRFPRYLSSIAPFVLVLSNELMSAVTEPPPQATSAGVE